MKNKSRGFTYIECIVSLSIIITTVSLVYTSLYSTFNLTNKNSQYNEMLNECKREIENMKYYVISSDHQTIGNHDNVFDNGSYSIQTKLEKIDNYYQCYKIDVKVYNDNTNIGLISYVTK